jgi:hypothetical protein
MYCGAELMLVKDDATAQEETLPQDLDVLFRAAMAKGNVGALQAALENAKTTAETPNNPAEPPVQDTPQIDIGTSLTALQAGAEEACKSWSAGDEAHVRRWLQDTGALIHALLQAMPPDREAAPPPEISLPKVHQLAALVVGSLGTADSASTLASCLQIDVATARLFAVSHYPRIVRRADDQAQLQARAHDIRDRLRVPATVYLRTDMVALGPAQGVARICGETPLTVEVFDVPRWDTEDGAIKPLGEVQRRTIVPKVLVTGDVVVQHYRASKGGGRLKHLRENRVREVSERRVPILDIHTDDGIYRVSGGHTKLDGVEGYQPSSFRRSLRALVHSLASQPEVNAIAPRVCQASLTRGGNAGAGTVKKRETGWATWEEHSRACALLFLRSD